MAVVQSSEIQRRLGLSIKDRESLVITPLLNERDAFSVDSIDLRLGGHFFVATGSSTTLRDAGL